MLLALAAMGLASCNVGFKKGDAGMLYSIIIDKSGPRIAPGDFISLNVILKTDADSVVGSTYENGRPFMNLMQKPQAKGDFYSALELLSEGDSAVIKLNIDTLSKGHPRPAGSKGKYQIYIVKVEKVVSKGNLSDEVFRGRYMAYVNQLSDQSKKAEPAKIDKYIKDNKLNVTKTDSGLYYQVTTTGTGIKPVVGDTVEVNYVGKFVNGKVFDTNIKSEAQKAKMDVSPMRVFKPLRFPVGVMGMIKGWNLGLPLLNIGSKATFVIPSSLAYGEQGNGPIAPFTPLVFDVELVSVTHPNPNAPKPVMPKMPMQLKPQPVKK